jgi:hypothetical protein
MADDLTKKGPQDRARVNVSEEWEVKYWTKELGITPEKLKEAVKAVGPNAQAIRKHLGVSAR